MNLQEQIRKVLKEETNYIRMMLRRIPSRILEKMDEEFGSSLHYVSKIFIKSFKSDPGLLTEEEFSRMVIMDLLTSLSVRQYFYGGEMSEEIIDGLAKQLTKHYQERITSMYNVLIR
jgi:hypothetical protein